MIGYHYHYWLKILTSNLELRETIVVVRPTQTVTVKEKGSDSTQTFNPGTTMRIEDPSTLFVDGWQGADWTCGRMVCLEIPWDKISSMGFSFEEPRPRQGGGYHGDL